MSTQILLNGAKSDGQIEGVVPHIVDEGLSILQYVDDTIIFMEHHTEKTRNLGVNYASFRETIGSKINFHKSNLFCFGEAQDEANLYTYNLAAGKACFLLGICIF
jgi:hypothetical protein